MSHDIVNRILQQLPPYQGKKRLIERNQDTFDIIREILALHRETVPHYNRIAIQHWQGHPEATCRHLFDFMRQHVPYKVEGTRSQTVKKPQAILSERLTFGNDCKHYASYIVGVLQALQRQGFPIRSFYRFASYNPRRRNPGHVFAVAVIGGREVWIDPVPEVGGYDSRSHRPFFKVDKLPPMSNSNSIGSLYEISGVQDQQQDLGRLRFKDHPFYKAHMKAHRMLLHPGQMLFRRRKRRIGDTEYLGELEYVGEAADAAAHLEDLVLQRRQVGDLDYAVGAVSDYVGELEYMGELDYAVGGYASIGKKKKFKLNIKAPKIKAPKLKVKLPHLKIQPGKLLLKVSMAPSRGSFLILVKLNVFGLAVKMWEKAARDQKSQGWSQLSKKWKSIGGKPAALLKAIKQGVSHYNKHHSKKIALSGTGLPYISDLDMLSGYEDGISGCSYMSGYPMDQDLSGLDEDNMGEMIGALPAVAAAIAAAAPVIKAMFNVLKSFGLRPDKMSKAAEKAQDDLAADHNASSGATDEEGTTTSAGAKTQAAQNADGSQTLAIKDVPGAAAADNDVAGEEHAGVKGDPPPKKSSGSYSPAGGDDDAGGDYDPGDKVITKTKTKTVTKHHSEDGDTGTFKDMVHNAWEFVKDHKGWFIGGGLAVAAIIVLPKLLSHKTRRR